MTFVDIARRRALETPAQLAYVLLDGEANPVAELRYAELWSNANRVAAALREHSKPGDRALLLYDSPLEFITAFLGCLVARVWAVPSFAPDPQRLERSLLRTRAIVAHATPSVALTEQGLVAAVRSLGVATLATDALAATSGDATPDAMAARVGDPETRDIALLQYTSGSTSLPRGVMVSHGNLLATSQDIFTAEDNGSTRASVTWLPFFHDMGLIEGLLQPLFAGFTAHVLHTRSFLARPMVWLEALSRYRGEISGAPNFAYRLAAMAVQRSVAQGQAPALELSAWKLGYSGAEPVEAATLAEFVEVLAPFGLRATTPRPVYGLAEATLLVSCGPIGTAARIERVDAAALERGIARAGAKPIVSVGVPCAHAQVRVVDPATLTAVADGVVGEVWLSGDSVALGYYNASQEDGAAFAAQLASGEGPFLRTGDLGFLRDGELFITGRRKDLIIVNGRNLYPQDLEACVEAADSRLRPGCSAAFAVSTGDSERVVVVSELSARAEATPDIAARVASALAETFEVALHALVLVPAGAVPKTSSGKLQRALAKRQWLDGALTVLASYDGAAVSELVLGFVLGDAAATARAAAWGITLNDDMSLEALGVDSLARAALLDALEQRLGRALWRERLMQARTLAELRELLVAEAPESSASRDEAQLAAAPASLAQIAFARHQRLYPTSVVHNVWVAVDVTPTPDANELSAAWTRLCAAYPVLMTCFEVEAAGVSRRPARGPAPLVLRDVPGDAVDAALAELVAQPFRLQHEPPSRAALVRHPGGAVLLLCAHHLAVDFASLERCLRELFAPDPASAPSVRRDDERFALAQAALVASPHAAALAEQWRQALASSPVALPLPLATGSGKAACVDVPLPKGFAARLRAAAQARGVSPFGLALDGVAAWLGRLSGAARPVVVTPMSLRPSGDAVGCFVNLVPVVLDARGDNAEALAEAKARAWFPYQLGARMAAREVALPYGHVAVTWHQPAQLGGLFSSRATQRIGASQLGWRAVPPAETEHALSVVFEDGGDALRARLVFAAERADVAMVQAWADALGQHLGRAVGAVAVEPPSSVPAAVAHDLGAETCLERFAAHVARTPERLAASDRGRRWSFAELDAQSDRLAGFLQAKAVGGGDVVGLCLEPSLETIAAALAVWKLGAAVFGINPDHPTAWIEQQLARAQPKLVLRRTEHTRTYPFDTPVPTYSLQDLADELSRTPPPGARAMPTPNTVAWVAQASTANDALQLVSGTHASLARHAAALASAAPYGDGDVGLVRSPPGAFHQWLEIAAPLMAGGAVYIADGGDHRCPAWLGEHLFEHGVTHVHATPTMLRGLLNAAFDAERRLVHSKYFLLHGELLTADLAERLRGYAPNARVVTVYGTVESGGAVLLDGRAVAGVTALVRDSLGEPALPGVTGRLFIDGAPSGEQARYGTDARIQVIAHDDGRVKLGGTRMYVAHVREVLRRMPLVRDAHVEASRDSRGDVRLGAWVVHSEPEARGAAFELRRALQKLIPDAWVPTSMILVPAIARDAAGQAHHLPPPPWVPRAKPDYSPPLTATEKRLAAIWMRLLSLERVGREDDFFALGGDSLLVMHVAHEASLGGLRLQPEQLTQHRTLRAVAEAVDLRGRD